MLGSGLACACRKDSTKPGDPYTLTLTYATFFRKDLNQVRKKTEALVVQASSNTQKIHDIENLVVAQAHSLDLLHIKTDAVLKHLGITPDALHPNPLSTISSLPTPSVQPNGSHQSPTKSRTARDLQITNEPRLSFPSTGFDENSDSIAAHAGAVLQHTSALLVHSARAMEARSREQPASGAHVHALIMAR